MRIGIITLPLHHNIGGILQAWALQTVLTRMGNEVMVIDKKPIVKSWLEEIGRFGWQIIKNILGSKIEIVLPFEIKAQYTNIFTLKKLNLWGRRNFSELKPSDFDAYVVGSDQLWNPTQGYCIEPYFLTFVPHGIGKKISFATSIGITDLRENEKIDFKRWLSKFDDISVRELQAQQMLQELLKDKKVHQVADPTFLMEPSFWQQLAVKPQKEGYILLFTLGRNDSLLSYGIKLSKESGLPLVSLRQVQPDAPNSEYIAVKDAGPKEFLGYISQADMVITDSFHCTVFSLIMGAKNFYTYIDPKNGRGSRIVDLLETYNLKNHLLDTSLLEEYNKLKARTVNHEEIFRIMSQERLRSQEFLNQYL